jgi:hypothetical protein
LFVCTPSVLPGGQILSTCILREEDFRVRLLSVSFWCESLLLRIAPVLAVLFKDNTNSPFWVLRVDLFLFIVTVMFVGKFCSGFAGSIL